MALFGKTAGATLVIGAAVVAGAFAFRAGYPGTSPAPRAATAPAATQPPAPPNQLAANTVSFLDVPYAHHDPALNTLDIYAPRDAKAAPVLLFVHGGEWSRGDKQPVSYKPKFFNEHGVIFIATNYRLSPKAPHPAQVDDVAEAIAWTHEHIGEYGGDPSKIVILGHSAGCHLVTYVALNPEPLAKAGMKPSQIAGVVAWSGGMYDLVARAAGQGMYPPFIKATFGESAEAQRAGSPMSYTKNAKDAPKFLIASTDETRAAESRDASQNLIDAINAAGGSAKSMTLAGRTHRAAIEQLGAPDDKTGPELMDFVKSVTH